MNKKKVSMSWSGGKDSAFALYKILLSGEYEVVNLHTVIDEETKRVGLHGVREDLLELQADNIGLPLVKVYLKSTTSHDAYEKLMKSFYMQCARQRLEGIIFGDIFLEDLRQYRERLLMDSRLIPEFPLWKIDTAALWDDFIHAGFKTMICSANAELFNEAELGKVLGLSFPQTLKPGVDVCGENGEFHTLVFDGPIFKKPLRIQLGEVVRKTYSYQIRNDAGQTENRDTDFLFQDLLPSMAW